MNSSAEIVVPLLEELSRLGIRYMVGGSFASSLWGQPRQTNDLDLALFLTLEDVPSIYEFSKHDFMGSEQEMRSAVNSSADFEAFQLLHYEETFKVDCFVLRSNDYTEASIAKAVRFEIAPGVNVPFSSAEDTVITKLRWFVLGNRISDKQWNDIVQVLEVQQGNLDEEYMDRWTAHFGVRDLLDEARSQVIRLDEPTNP